MTKTSPVAPELAAGLTFFPDLDFSNGIAPFRGLDMPVRPVPAELEGVTRAEVQIPGAAGAPDVRALLYTPPGTVAPLRPAVLHIHGGGYVLGNPDMNDVSNRALALAHDCLVLSVDYRLAPETPFPGARDDCLAALRWLQAEAGRLGIDPRRIAVAGESAGGGHAVALALHARDAGSPDIAFLLLDAPMLDDRTGTSADPHPHGGRLVWTPDRNRFGWSALLGTEAGSAAVPADAVPARAADLSGLPPTFISVGALDLFLEENLEWTRRCARAGVPVELHVVAGAYHGFGVAQDAPQSRDVQHLRDRALRRALGRASTPE